jgi:N,N'-diacetyllegionaminate synthase
LKHLELNDEAIEELFYYSRKKGIIFLSSAFDKESVDLLDKLGVPAFKIASGEITNFPLLKYTTSKRRPIILSTGMATLDEITEALDVILQKNFKDVALLHCITSYPAKIETTNLRAIEILRKRFRVPIGFSDHTIGALASVAAVVLGAVIIEKHFTLDRTLPGPDHQASMEPTEFRSLVNSIRNIEKALNAEKTICPEEEAIKQLVRRSIVAKVRIPKNTIICENMVDFKRPAGGIEPKYLSKVVGKKAKIDIESDDLITSEKLL